MIEEDRNPNLPPMLYNYTFEDADFLRMLLVVQLQLHPVLVKLLETRKRPAENALDPVICCLACHAAKRGYKGIVRILLAQEDVDWNIYGPCDETLLMLVAEWNDEDILRTVLQQGCPVNAISYQESALHRVVNRGYTSSIRILLEAGADVDSCGKYGQSIISQAIIGEASGETLGKMIDLLLEYKADINAHGWHGNTPLHYAAATPILDTYAVEYLISKGANPNLPNEKWTTPLDLAKDVIAFGEIVVWVGEGPSPSEVHAERATRIIPILQKAGGKTAKEMLQPSIGEQGPCFPPEWLDSLEKIKERNSLYNPGAPPIQMPERTLWSLQQDFNEEESTRITLLPKVYQPNSN